MAETLYLPQSATKSELYSALVPQIEALVSGEDDLTANLANITAALKEAFGVLSQKRRTARAGAFSGAYRLHPNQLRQGRVRVLLPHTPNGNRARR